MKKRDLHARNLRKPKKPERVKCDSPELNELITVWTQKCGWKFADFADFLDLTVGKDSFFMLYDLRDGQFKCQPQNGDEVKLSLCFGDIDMRLDGRIAVKKGDETSKTYRANTKDTKNVLPQVIYESKTIKKEGKTLITAFGRPYTTRKLQTKELTLKVKIHNTKESYEEQGNSLKNSTEIEEYFLGLDKTLTVRQVFNDTIRLLDMSQEEIKESEKISVSCVRKSEDGSQVLDKILLLRGKLKEVATYEDGESIHIYIDGNWEYSNKEGLLISSKNGKYTFYKNGEEVKKDPWIASCLIRAEIKISNIMQWIEEE